MCFIGYKCYDQRINAWLYIINKKITINICGSTHGSSFNHHVGPDNSLLTFGIGYLACNGAVLGPGEAYHAD